MVNEFNENILNKTNIQPFKDIALSQENDVPIYVLNGQPFKALIRGWGKRKDYPLTKSDIEHRYDGASFSIDSSDLLNPFQDPHDTYTIAYSSIPKKQLIHAFPTDSDTDYKRNGLDIASTTSLGRIDNPFDYLTEYNSDLRLDSMLSKPSPDTPKIARSSDDYDID